jgi:hypothetical protein
MRDLLRDWRHWSRAERTAATLLASFVVTLPAVLLLTAV